MPRESQEAGVASRESRAKPLLATHNSRLATHDSRPGPLFRSFFLAGFECSSHRNSAGRRLDMIAATGHDRLAHEDYARLREQDLRAARDGIRWHLVEPSPYRYDFRSVLPLARAARDTGTQVVWDLCHYGWPDDLDVFDDAFLRRFAALARAFVRWLMQESDEIPFLAPINEVSFLAWAGGAVALFPPYLRRRGREMKRQLVRAILAGCDAIWEVCPQARICHIDPICNIVADPQKPRDRLMARRYHLSQFHVWDMICGRLRPELGGHPRYLDVVGVNYYIDNQWLYPGSLASDTTIGCEHPQYRPVWHLLRDVWRRYRRPLFVAETGIEDDARPAWLRYIGREVRDALRAGIPVEGLCLYPILNHPGWEDERHCRNGLWDYPDEAGSRVLYAPLAEELRRQQRAFAKLRK